MLSGTFQISYQRLSDFLVEIFDVLLVPALLLFLGVGVYLECLLQLSCCRSPHWALDSPWTERSDCSFLVPLLLSESTFSEALFFYKEFLQVSLLALILQTNTPVFALFKDNVRTAAQWLLHGPQYAFPTGPFLAAWHLLLSAFQSSEALWAPKDEHSFHLFSSAPPELWNHFMERVL